MLSATNSRTRALTFKFSQIHHQLCPTFSTKTHMDLLPKTLFSPATSSVSSSSLSSSPIEFYSGEATIGLQEWRAWGTTSPVPAMIAEIVEDLKGLERETNAQMSFGVYGGKIQDSLRQNNTGKLLWQVFGIQAASLCVFGIVEHEEIMWKEFMHAGKSKVWCLYPNKNAATNSIQDIFCQDSSRGSEFPLKMTNQDEIMHFILFDGTWNNSAAMFWRLKERANLVWGEDIPCISLTTGASAMHKLCCCSCWPPLRAAKCSRA